MIIEAVPSGPLSTNAYLLACATSKEAIIIDPSPASAKRLEKLISDQKLHVKAIYLTHSHWDHIADVAELKNHYSVPVYIHPLDQENLIEPGSDTLPLLMKITGVKPDGLLQDQDIIKVGNLEGVIIHTPGHSPGGVCFYFPNEHLLVSGDTLFKGCMGSLSLPTSDSTSMWHSLAKLSKLPPDTKVMPGHGSFTTIGKESWLSRAEEIFG